MKADFFTSLASQVLGAEPGIHPLLLSRYATWPGVLNTGEAVTAPENSSAAEEGTASFAAPLVDPLQPSIHVPAPSLRQMANPTLIPQPALGMDEVLIPEAPGTPTEIISPETRPTAPLIQAQHSSPTGPPTPAPPDAPPLDADYAPKSPEPVPPLSPASTFARKPAAWPASPHSPDREAHDTPVETGETRAVESEYPVSLKPELLARPAVPPELVPNRPAPLRSANAPAKPILPPAAAAVPPVETSDAGVASRAEHPYASPLPSIPNRAEALQAQPEEILTRLTPVPYQPDDRKGHYAPTERPIESPLPQSLTLSPASQPEAPTVVPAESRAPDWLGTPLPQTEPSNVDTIQRQTLPTKKQSSSSPIQPAPLAQTVQPLSPATQTHPVPEKPMRNPIPVETLATLWKDAPAEPVIRPISEAMPLMAHEPRNVGARQWQFLRPEASAPEPIPTVSVSIGRVIVRASFEPELPPPEPVKLPQPPLSLGDYLKSRQKGGR